MEFTDMDYVDMIGNVVEEFNAGLITDHEAMFKIETYVLMWRIDNE